MVPYINDKKLKIGRNRLGSCLGSKLLEPLQPRPIAFELGRIFSQATQNFINPRKSTMIAKEEPVKVQANGKGGPLYPDYLRMSTLFECKSQTRP